MSSKETEPKKQWTEYIPKSRQTKTEKTPNKIQFKEYIPRRQLKQKFQKKNEYAKELENKEEEDEYSGLAVSNTYKKKQKKREWRNHEFSGENYCNDFKMKWKTEICHYWEMYGFCKFGDNCAFAHGTEELNKRKMSSNYKTKLCKQFFESGYCSYGVRCQFSHKKIAENEDENGNKKNEENNQVSYFKILYDLVNNNQIDEEILKRPRLMTFENIASCTLDESENNRKLLYEDIIHIQKKSSNDVFSEDTHDECSENNENENNENKNNENENNENGNNENEKNENKRETIISA